MCAVQDQIAPWVEQPFFSLGTDGFGLSDTRGALRRHFKVDAESIAIAVLTQLAKSGEVEQSVITEAIEKYQIFDISAADPWQYRRLRLIGRIPIADISPVVYFGGEFVHVKAIPGEEITIAATVIRESDAAFGAYVILFDSVGKEIARVEMYEIWPKSDRYKGNFGPAKDR